jgi:hypothetical protein
MYNLYVSLLLCSYVFRLSQSTHHQAEYKKYKEKIIYQ